MRSTRILFTAGIGIVAAGFLSNVAAQNMPVPRPGSFYTVPTDTVIRVRMDTELNSKTARVRDRLTATTVAPVKIGSNEALPAGCKLLGRVTNVTRASATKPATIGVSFDSIMFADGWSLSISAALASLLADDVNSDNEKARPRTQRDAVFIGGGAATGAIIGAAGGARAKAAGSEVSLTPGKEFGVRLRRELSVPRTRR